MSKLRSRPGLSIPGVTRPIGSSGLAVTSSVVLELGEDVILSSPRPRLSRPGSLQALVGRALVVE